MEEAQDYLLDNEQARALVYKLTKLKEGTLTIPDLAKELNCTPTHLYQLKKRHNGFFNK